MGAELVRERCGSMRRRSRGCRPVLRSSSRRCIRCSRTVPSWFTRTMSYHGTWCSLGRSVRIWAGTVLLCTGSAASAEDSRTLGFGAPAPAPPSPPNSPSPQLPPPAALGFVGVCKPGFESASPSAASGWFPWEESAPSAVTPWVDTSSGPARVRWREVRRALFLLLCVLVSLRDMCKSRALWPCCLIHCIEIRARWTSVVFESTKRRP
mmetsp:Transcript_16925/g.32756  ORF Transcript_16925/g.32756 Transcript_16925/m.32756 type:complete len:209 (-) Transcript_16925:585-1211(-)